MDDKKRISDAKDAFHRLIYWADETIAMKRLTYGERTDMMDIIKAFQSALLDD